jgi:hypothetical protein
LLRRQTPDVGGQPVSVGLDLIQLGCELGVCIPVGSATARGHGHCQDEQRSHWRESSVHRPLFRDRIGRPCTAELDPIDDRDRIEPLSLLLRHVAAAIP